MGMNTTHTLDCDKCGNELEDCDGLVAGSYKYLTEKAHLAGWKFAPDRDGWYCSACLVVPIDRRTP
jgi:hypothetical protein